MFAISISQFNLDALTKILFMSVDSLNLKNKLHVNKY